MEIYLKSIETMLGEIRFPVTQVINGKKVTSFKSPNWYGRNLGSSFIFALVEYKINLKIIYSKEAIFNHTFIRIMEEFDLYGDWDDSLTITIINEFNATASDLLEELVETCVKLDLYPDRLMSIRGRIWLSFRDHRFSRSIKSHPKFNYYKLYGVTYDK